jgi:hydrogenase maturation protease
MNRALVDRIADAVLYEGYILYPYRPSVKNRQRWTFGGLYPEAWCRTQGAGADAPASQTECLVAGSAETRFEAVVRFLHLTARLVGEYHPPLADWPDGESPAFRLVEALRVGDRLYQTWQEAEEREVVLAEVTLGELSARPRSVPFAFPGGRRSEPVLHEAGQIVGALVREQEAVAGAIEEEAAPVAEGLFRVTLRVVNRTPLEEAERRSRDEALLRSLASAHTILAVRGGEFVSLLDPPECWREQAASCRNVGTWPVLVGAEGQRDMMLASPIILYDYPQVAPESPGDFFDGTEIDEMLTLRILTLTDEEKRAMLAVDERAGALLARTEALAREQLLGLHGRVRGLRRVPEEGAHG